MPYIYEVGLLATALSTSSSSNTSTITNFYDMVPSSISQSRIRATTFISGVENNGDSNNITLPRISDTAPPQIDISTLDIAHLHLPILGVDLICDFKTRDLCHDLQSVKRNNLNQQPHHFALRFRFAGSAQIPFSYPAMHIDMVPESLDIANSPGVVRLFSTTPPHPVGIVPLRSVLMSPVASGVTGKKILDLIVIKRLNLFWFSASSTEQGGCRHWIYELSKEMEMAGMIRKDWADDVLERLNCFWLPGPEGRGTVKCKLLHPSLVEGILYKNRDQVRISSVYRRCERGNSSQLPFLQVPASLSANCDQGSSGQAITYPSDKASLVFFFYCHIC